MNFELLLQHYGYLAVLCGTFLEGEAALVLGGLAAQQGLLDIGYVILAAFVGGVAGDQMYFFLGRRYGRAVLARKPEWQARADQTHRMMQRYRSGMILGLRFMYGLRMPAAFALGTSGVSTRRFVVLHVIGSALWAVLLGTGGYFFGAIIKAIFEQLSRNQLSLAAVAAGTAVAAWTLWRFRGYRRVP